MKRKWIIPTAVLLFVLLLTGVYATRNQWAAYALRRLVNFQSKGQIVLDFNRTEVDVFSRTLAIIHPEITFKKVYFNKARSTSLKKAEFQKLTLINISLWDFIAHKQFICDNLIIEKPTFTLGKNKTGVKTGSSSFDPAALINVLQKHEITHLNFRFLIHHSQINFGKIGFHETKGKKVYGSAHYNMIIENMGTIKTSGGVLQPLEFQKLELSVRALHRHFTSERTDIKLDSAFYSSQNSSLFLNGLTVVSTGKIKTKIPQTRLYLRWAKISGLKTERQKKTGKKILQLSNIKVVGGSYSFKIKQRKQEKKSVSELIKNLFASYNILSLDSLSLKHIHLFEVGNRQDTILMIKRINLDMNKIWTTKNILTDPVKSLHYQNLTVSYRTLDIGNNKSLLFVSSGIARYATNNNRLVINGLKIRTRCKTDTSASIFFGTGKLSIDSLSDKAFQKGKPQLLAVGLDSPQLIWKKDSICQQQKQTAFPDILRSFQIAKVNIKNGNFIFESNENLKLDISEIHLFANGLQGTQLRGQGAAIRYDSLFFYSHNSRLSIENTGLLLKTKELLWQHRQFRVTGFRYLQADTSRKDTLNIRSLTLTKPQLNPLIFGQKLIATGAFFYKAHFSQELHQVDTLTDTLPARHWNSFVRLPFKTDIGFIRIRKSSFSLTSRNPDKNFNISSQLDMRLERFKMGYDSAHLISQPGRWKATLANTKIRQNNLTIQLKKTDLNSDSGTLQIQDVALRQIQDSTLQYSIGIPRINLLSLNYSALMHSDSLLFGKAIMQQGQVRLHLINFNKKAFDKTTTQWTFIYDSLIFRKMQLEISIRKDSRLKIVNIDDMNLYYHPNLLLRSKLPKITTNLMKAWDFDIAEATYSDMAKKFYMVADRVALQSAENRMKIKRIIGTNFSTLMLHPDIKNVYTYFLTNNISLNGLNLSNGANKEFSIKSWTIPGIWVSVIDNDTTKKKRSLSFLSSNFFSQYTHILRSLHVDSSIFRNVNFNYRYDNMSKLINIKGADISISDIQLGNRALGKPSDALFGNMLISLNDRAILSGDSMYTFRTKDIRVNLAERKISLDSITITPRYSRNDFFAKAGFQTDRITLYGKSAVLDGFSPNDLVNNHLFHFGKLHLNNLSLRFERDMHYPRKNSIKPMPIDMLARIPYHFRIDSVQVKNSMVSFFQYEVISKNPGIFFIDNFNIHAENVTNDLLHIDSNMVLKFHGYGKLMKQANLDFTLVMPYFAPHRQWWFSAEAGQIDLTQFNLLTENVLGLTIRSGKGSLEVPLITGNDSVAKGAVNFLYKKLKLRLYNREKSEKSRKFYSPFANFVMNSIVIHSNNPPFLGHTKKGIVYFERIPEKSFINYLWKSNLSGILSTFGFNNKQQREGKREDKKQMKNINKNKPNPEKKK